MALPFGPRPDAQFVRALGSSLCVDSSLLGPKSGQQLISEQFELNIIVPLLLSSLSLLVPDQGFQPKQQQVSEGLPEAVCGTFAETVEQPSCAACREPTHPSELHAPPWPVFNQGWGLGAHLHRKRGDLGLPAVDPSSSLRSRSNPFPQQNLHVPFYVTW